MSIRLAVRIPPKVTKSQNVNFQYKWFQMWPWLHYSESLKGVLCFTCSSAYQQGLLDLANKKEDAFISTGFNNWKKVTGLGKHKLGRFQEHEMSETHRFAAVQLKAQKQATVIAQVAEHKCKQQELNRRMLVKVFTSVRYLARQGLPLRGHEDDEGNFWQLLHLREEDDPNLAIYTVSATSYTSPQAQNEMLKDFSHSVLRQVVKNVRNNGVFAIMVDGTQDITGVEQESVCIRHVDEDLNVHEHFAGLHEVPSSSGEMISSIIFDVLTRLGLSINNLRAQTYDGASNMSGKYNGCQAKMKEQQPLARFFHCSSHVSNLVMQHAVTTSPLVRDALQWVHDLGVLYSRSGKYKAIFKDIAEQLHPGTSTASIRPLCPTRWLCRQSAVESVVNNYGTVLESLEEMSMLGTRMKTAVNTVMSELQALRKPTVFETIFTDTSSLIVKHNLEPLRLPRLRKPPARLSGEASPYHANTAEEHFLMTYYQHIDGILSNLSERFGEGSKADLQDYEKLEQIITTGIVSFIIRCFPSFRLFAFVYGNFSSLCYLASL
ncbi:Zinc finger MYM-type protein 1 [Holothuria leucospilota]|uniref:Zinc finger MYM-type protein 1 n=1 Tax=Holothuria leucospilota TaxID=206669 RepID=A0A9Q1CSU8_HOLLE|nr:Zinc finger MYM-type protein 1 [Holothuria leucospilota]